MYHTSWLQLNSCSASINLIPTLSIYSLQSLIHPITVNWTGFQTHPMSRMIAIFNFYSWCEHFIPDPWIPEIAYSFWIMILQNLRPFYVVFNNRVVLFLCFPYRYVRKQGISERPCVRRVILPIFLLLVQCNDCSWD